MNINTIKIYKELPKTEKMFLLKHFSEFLREKKLKISHRSIIEMFNSGKLPIVCLSIETEIEGFILKIVNQSVKRAHADILASEKQLSAKRISFHNYLVNNINLNNQINEN